MPPLRQLAAGVVCLATVAGPATAAAQALDGKQLLVNGVSSIDGAAGGALTPWAVTGGHGTAGEFGGSAFATRIKTRDFALTAYGAALAYGDRIEVSLARQSFDTGPLGSALGQPGIKLKQDILGVKLRVAGDAELDSDSYMPQIAIGAEHKRADAGPLESTLSAFGAKDSGTDLYVSATKLLLAQGILFNATLRATKANQNGLLGFGATGHTGYRIKPEVSLAWQLRPGLALGAEYRAKPNNFRDNTALGAGALNEGEWVDVFLAWAPSRHFSLTGAFVDLGRIAPGVVGRRQNGVYLSAQAAF